MTKKQRKREELAKLHDDIAKKFGEKKSEFADFYRAVNRRVEKRKGRN